MQLVRLCATSRLCECGEGSISSGQLCPACRTAEGPAFDVPPIHPHGSVSHGTCIQHARHAVHAVVSPTWLGGTTMLIMRKSFFRPCPTNTWEAEEEGARTGAHQGPVGGEANEMVALLPLCAS